MQTELQNRAFLLLLALVTVAFALVLVPFYGAVLWAVILAIIFRPLQRRLELRLRGRKNLAAALSVLVVVLIAILPMTVVIAALINQGAALVARIQASDFPSASTFAEIVGALPGWAQDAVVGFGVADFEAVRERFAQAVAAATQFLASQALVVGQNTLRLVGSAGIMLYVLFFLFRDGLGIGASIRASLPFSPKVSDALIARFAAVVRGTVKGNLIIALIQGTIGGVTFALLGIQGALVWGAIMVFASLLPAVGAALIWVPFAVYLLLTGDTLSGVILIAVGAGIISIVDNLLRPPLVGKETRLPDYVVLVSTVGGLSLFGVNGFVIGPMIAALFVACWTLFRDARADRLARL